MSETWDFETRLRAALAPVEPPADLELRLQTTLGSLVEMAADELEAWELRAVKDPRGVLADFGVKLAKETEIRVWDSTAETRFLVLPMRPAGTEEWSEERLADLVTRDSMIGTGLALKPAEVAK